MTTIYDDKGFCTRCKSLGYYLGHRTIDLQGQFLDGTELRECQCHGWRPIEFLQITVGESVDLYGPKLRPVEASVDSNGGFRDARWTRINAKVTHFRLRPQPPQ